ncbi:hypothetical protein [Bradyrhizobium guangdongense]|uniref:hypothetical protein n=1 Tax=Bradyrhizobium guangdongense TaxID=1325090 RepID=UPI00131A1FA2|nr:hypothetical protein [Bradyrhizobium guangdongense]
MAKHRRRFKQSQPLEARLAAEAERLPIPPPDLDRAEEIRQMVREDIEEQRKFIEKLKRKMN